MSEGSGRCEDSLCLSRSIFGCLPSFLVSEPGFVFATLVEPMISEVEW